MERCSEGRLRVEPRELAEDKRVQAGEAGGSMPARSNRGLEGRQGGDGECEGRDGDLKDDVCGGGAWGCGICLGLGWGCGGLE